MIVCSFDIGLKNLAYCILDHKNKIHSWENIDLFVDTYNSGEKKICQSKLQNNNNCTSEASYFSNTGLFVCGRHTDNKEKKLLNIDNISYSELAMLIISKLNTIDFSMCDEIVIEKQPDKARDKIKVVSIMLLNYFILNYIIPKKNIKDVKFIDPRNKLTIYTGPYIECKLKGSYPRNKFYAKEYCKYFLECSLTDNLQWYNYFKNSDKKDDLSDSYLQGRWYLSTQQHYTKDTKEIKDGIIKLKLKKDYSLPDDISIPTITGKNKIDIENNIYRYKSIQKTIKPKNDSRKYTMSNIKYMINKYGIDSINKNTYLKSSILFFFKDIDMFIDHIK
jgi:hypothetical protein